MATRRGLVLLLAVLLLLAACDAGISSVTGASVTPVPTITSAHREKVTAQYCADDTGSYPHEDFRGANRLVAQSVVDAVTPNTDGLTLYATLINSRTFDPASSLDPFIIPAIPAYPTLPAPVATPTQGNPISYEKEKRDAAAKQDAAISAYNDQMAAATKQLADLKKQVTTDTARLVNLDPPVDEIATSVWGCLQRARERFQGVTGKKYLIIASDMENNTNVDYTTDFTRTRALDGVTVAVVYYYCADARTCQSKTAQWQGIFAAAGAASATFTDPAQSSVLNNLFGGA
jgi:hypothetical protein